VDQIARASTPSCSPYDRPWTHSSCRISVSRDDEKKYLAIGDWLTFNGETTPDPQDNPEVSNYPHSILDLPQTSFDDDTSSIHAMETPDIDRNRYKDVIKKGEDTHGHGLTASYDSADGRNWTNRDGKSISGHKERRHRRTWYTDPQNTVLDGSLYVLESQ
jgi:hypothetical protein